MNPARHLRAARELTGWFGRFSRICHAHFSAAIFSPPSRTTPLAEDDCDVLRVSCLR